MDWITFYVSRHDIVLSQLVTIPPHESRIPLKALIGCKTIKLSCAHNRPPPMDAEYPGTHHSTI